MTVKFEILATDDDGKYIKRGEQILEDGRYHRDSLDICTEEIIFLNIGPDSSDIEVRNGCKAFCSDPNKPKIRRGKTFSVIIREGENFGVYEGTLAYQFTQLRNPNKEINVNNRNWFRKQGLRY